MSSAFLTDERCVRYWDDLFNGAKLSEYGQCNPVIIRENESMEDGSGIDLPRAQTRLHNCESLWELILATDQRGMQDNRWKGLQVGNVFDHVSASASR
jgi:hypothetical protein